MTINIQAIVVKKYSSKNKLLLLLLTLIFIVTASSAVAEIYQWKDKNGNVHFSDKPIANDKQKVKQLKLKAGNNISFAKSKDSDWQKSLEDEKTLKSMDKKAQAREKLKDQKRQALCDHWRSRMEIYKQAGPIAIMSPQGERHYLNEAERKQQSKKLLKNIRDYCR